MEDYDIDSQFLDDIVALCGSYDAQLIEQHFNLINAVENAGGGQIGHGPKQTAPKRAYEYKLESRQYNRKFNCDDKTYSLEITPTAMTFNDAVRDTKNLFQQIYDDFIRDVPATDRVNLVIDHDMLRERIHFAFLRPREYTPEIIMNTFDRIVQSQKLGDDPIRPRHRFTVKVGIARLPSGSGRRRVCKEKRIMTSFEKFLTSTSSIKVVVNNDSLCLLRAVIIAKAFEPLVVPQEARNMYNRQQTSKLMMYQLRDMCRATDIWQGPCGIPELIKIEDYLHDYQIMLINGNGKSNEPLYLNNSRPFSKFLYIVLHDEHYYAVTSMKIFMGTHYYCDYCKHGYKTIGDHTCKYTCTSCKRSKCHIVQAESSSCSYCHVDIRNNACRTMHTETFCPKVKYCRVCNKGLHKYTSHVCENQRYCANCKCGVDMDHRCYIKQEPEQPARPERFAGYIFFDYETYRNEEGMHIPNLVIAKKRCAMCLDQSEPCQDCDTTFKFYDNVSFCTWLLTNKHYIAMAHNSKSYDGVFIANYCINDMRSNEGYPDMIATPTKLLQIKFRSVTIKDSLSFLNMPLDKFPKTFGLNEMCKGFFPHKFNKPENASYVGFYPHKSYYDSEYFSVSKKAEFDAFYAINKYNLYHHQNELEKYCESDVNILMEGCLRFRRIIMNQTKLHDADVGVDPFRVAITLPSLCNYIYRRNYMPPNSIAVIPDNGYYPRQNTSKKANQWLKYISVKNNVDIQSEYNGYEYKVGHYQVDGYCESTNTIYDFLGCYYHGCNKCYQHGTWNSVRNYTMGYLRFNTMKRRDKIKQLMPGVHYVELWECDYDAMCKTDPELRSFISLNPVIEPLRPRDALFGGRTNAFKLYHKCASDEQIKYYDFTSLYPACQKQEDFPIGHPIMITSFSSLDIILVLSNVKYYHHADCMHPYCLHELTTS